MAITTTQVTQICDSIAQACSDFNTNYVTGTASAATTINAGVGGTGATSATYGRVLNMLDSASELALLTKTNTVAANVAADITGRRSLTAFYSNYFPLLDALDTLVGGLNAYLGNNAIQINAFTAAAFNAYVTNSVILNYRTSANIPVSIATANYFPYAAIDNMWSFVPSGATTFTSNAVGANASTSVSGGGIGTFYIYRSDAGTASAAGATLTITYTNAAGVSATTTYSSATAVPAISGSLAAGYTLGVTGTAITAVSGTGMTNLNAGTFVIGMKSVRASAY